MGRPAKLTRERLQAAALALVDEQGLGGLTMRALAERVGTAPMTLYNHVQGRAELEALVVDAALGEARWQDTPDADWRDAVRDVATAMWRAARAHPQVIPLIPARRSRSAALREPSEALLAALARSGRDGAALLVAFRSVTALVLGFAQGELAGPLTAAAGEAPAAVIEQFRALPAFRYPHLIEIATAAATSDPEDEFRAGLELLIAGLAAKDDADAAR